MTKLLLIAVFSLGLFAQNIHKINSDELFYEQVVKNAPNAKSIKVKDTDSPLGRENLYAKELGLATLIKAHGHFCDGLALTYVELSAALKKLFPDGVVDRTDIRVVAKNAPCLVDTSSIMSGARINHRTLSLDNSLGGSFIVQKISTGQTYKVSLKDKSFLKKLKTKEKEIKAKKAKGLPVTPQDIDEVEALAHGVIKHLLYTDKAKLVTVKELKNYKFHFSTKDFGARSDIINKNVAR